MIEKVASSADTAVESIGDGTTMAVGGFGLSGVPPVLIEVLDRRGGRIRAAAQTGVNA